MPKFYKWTVEIEVAEAWVADGFDLTDRRAHDIMTHHLSYANGNEIKCKVVARPKDHDVATEQGYKTTAAYLLDRK